MQGDQECLVSIIVPIYNVEAFLCACLRSIQEQNYENFEVIMVNDGSKDGSRNIAEKFQEEDERFRLVDKENGGLSSARNFGMQYVRGDFVSFIDSDDFLSKSYISSLYNAFDNETDIVVADYVIYNSKKNKSYKHRVPLQNQSFVTHQEKNDLLRYLIFGEKPVMSMWKNMYRVSFYKQQHLSFISEREVYAEDLLFNTEAYSLAKKVKIISNIVYYHLVNPGSLSQGYRKNYFQMNKTLHLRVLEKLKENGFEELYYAYKNQESSYIGSSLFNMSKCGIDEAIKNIGTILSDNTVKESYKNNTKTSGPFRYRVLYDLGKLKSPGLIVFCVKVMLMVNPIYRVLQLGEVYES